MIILSLLILLLWRCACWEENYEERKFKRYMKYYRKYGDR